MPLSLLLPVTPVMPSLYISRGSPSGYHVAKLQYVYTESTSYPLSLSFSLSLSIYIYMFLPSASFEVMLLLVKWLISYVAAH